MLRKMVGLASLMAGVAPTTGLRGVGSRAVCFSAEGHRNPQDLQQAEAAWRNAETEEKRSAANETERSQRGCLVVGWIPKERAHPTIERVRRKPFSSRHFGSRQTVPLSSGAMMECSHLQRRRCLFRHSEEELVAALLLRSEALRDEALELAAEVQELRRVVQTGGGDHVGPRASGHRRASASACLWWCIASRF